MEPLRAFLSYSSRNRGFASTLYEDLRVCGLEIWIDLIELAENDRRTDAEVESALREALTSCDVALPVVTDASLASPWVRFEMECARSQRIRTVPLLDELTMPLPAAVEALDPIDFAHGYNTAFARLLQRLGRVDASADPVRLAVALARFRAEATRTLASGPAFAEHVRMSIADEALSNYAVYLGGEYARLDRSGRLSETLANVESWARTWVLKPYIDGTRWTEPADDGSGLRMALSAVPNPRLFDEEGEPALVIASFYRPGTPSTGTPDCTLAAAFEPSGGATLWLAYGGALHHYTMGKPGNPARLLMERRRMGAEPYLFVPPAASIPTHVLTLQQGLQNRRGGGVLGVPAGEFAAEIPARGIVREVLRAAAARNWLVPAVRQESAVTSHLRLGGTLVWETSKDTGVTPVLARQLHHLFECAGAMVRNERGRREPARAGEQWVSVSPLQADLLSP